MNNSFTELYNSYSNIELLEIVNNASSYQPEAVVAAENVLKTRNVSAVEFTIAETKIAETKYQKPFIQQLFKKYNDYFFSSVPSIHSLGWLNIIPLIFILTVISSVYSSIENIPYCISHNDLLNLSLYVANLIAIAFIIYLFKIQSKWFWILLFADKIIGIFTNIKTFIVDVFHNIINYMSIKMFINDFFNFDYLVIRSLNIFQIIISIAVIYYLNKTELKSYYNINTDTIRKIMLVVGIIIVIAGIAEIISLITYYKASNADLYFQF